MGTSSARFSGRTAIVTGAGSGLGRATAARIAAERGAVACLDVTDPASVREAVSAATRDLGRPSVVVTCAGIGRFANSHEMPFEDWARIIGVNLTGTFLTAQAALPYLLDGGGNIVTISSNAGLMGVPYSAAYCASKGGVIQLTKALAAEYLGRGVRANCVAPGGIKTPLQKAFHQLPDGADPEIFRDLMTPLGNSTPAEVAALIAFVASDEGRYMTGSVVSIDGGLTMRLIEILLPLADSSKKI